MKRTIFAVALSAVLLCGCGAGAPPVDAPAADEGDLIIVKETYAEDGNYTDSLDNSWTYSYHVPSLPADTEGAKAINAAIDAKFGQSVQESLAAMEDGLSLGCVTATWKSYRWGDVLSIVVQAEAEWEFTDYGVYLYNIATGQQMTTTALLEALGVAPETFLSALRQSAAQAFDSQRIADNAQSSTDFLPERSWTVGDGNITPDVMAYVREDGTLRVVLPIGTPAGAGWYYQTITPELTTGEEVTFTAGSYRLSRTEGTETMTLMDGDGVERTVYGAWSKYTDAAYVAEPTESEDETPHEWLVLLTEGAQVEYIDLTSGVAGGTLCVTPLAGVGKAVSLETAAENGAVCAVTEENRWVELLPLLRERTGGLPETLAAAWHMAVADSGVEHDCWLTLTEDGAATWQQGMLNSADGVFYTGTVTCLGTTEEGMVLYLDLTTDAASGEQPVQCAVAAAWGWEGVQFKYLSGNIPPQVEGYVWADTALG